MISPGTVLAGRYQVESVLGKGGMGAVYLATMEALGGKKVAIKEMEMRGFSDKELQAAVKQFQSEARFLANLDHPNLVQVTDFFVEGDRHYLVMAYVPGQTLQQKLRVRGRPFAWSQVKEWAQPLCAVLGYLHTQNPPILFRDLKPSNVMVEESGRLRLIDFGIARTGQDGERTSTFLQGTGTSGFSPLEQYGGSQSTDHRSDIYSLGATLYQLLTGKVPPDAVSRVSQGKAVPQPSSLVADLPAALDPVLLRSLAMNKDDRYQSVAEMWSDLERVSEQPGEAVTEDSRSAAVAVAPVGPVGPTGGGAAGVGPSDGTAPSAGPGSPAKVTVELMPSAPTTTPLQVATGLGAAAVVTLLLGTFLLDRTPATAASAATPAPARLDEPATPSRPEAPAMTSEPAPEKPPAAPVSRPAKERPEPLRERPSQTSARDREQSQPQAPPQQPKTVRKVVRAVAANRSSVPTARPVQKVEPEAVRPAVQATAEVRIDPEQIPPRPGGFRPPPVPEGMPTPRRGPDGQFLPPDQQGPGFPGYGPPRHRGHHPSPAEVGEAPPGYESRPHRP